MRAQTFLIGREFHVVFRVGNRTGGQLKCKTYECGYPPWFVHFLARRDWHTPMLKQVTALSARAGGVVGGATRSPC